MYTDLNHSKTRMTTYEKEIMEVARKTLVKSAKQLGELINRICWEHNVRTVWVLVFDMLFIDNGGNLVRDMTAMVSQI